METYEPSGAPTPTPTPAAEGSSSSTSTAAPDAAQQWFEGFSRAVQKQLQVQESLMRQLMTDIQEYLTDALGWNENGSSALERVNAMLEMISSRMAITREAATDMVSTAEAEEQAAREASRKVMREVRVQDIVVDALWASLRGVQASAWMGGIGGHVEEADVFNAANRAAEEFLARMYHNLRAAGIAEEDIVKYVPKTVIEETISSSPTRNMGSKSRGYSYYNYGYRYPHYTYGYAHPYPTFYSYPTVAYPRYTYNYSWGYPMQSSFGWSSPRFFSSSCSTCNECSSRLPLPGEPLMHEVEPIHHRRLGEEGPMMMGGVPFGYNSHMMPTPQAYPNNYNSYYNYNYNSFPPTMNSRYNTMPFAANNANYPQQQGPTSAAAAAAAQQQPLGRMGSLGSPYGYAVTPNSGYQQTTFRNLGVWEGPEMINEPFVPFVPFGMVEP
ncbi:56 kDa gametocyte antigen, related [Eimeria acervulina]|uniref:56 kDa gametocyte antigen, related n=1 Tax=Eimeria acervulina TaxID=5801 RepID=U6GHD7_EIMAC|nr:56 kDa gametocyte antigen, related [Eimeria acervulina]QDH76308.1 56 kDa gametocyte protein [Eimeria acervulina]CDI78698.1 56 kDa gametocyte antigen, related [Eimeria acervulina]